MTTATTTRRPLSRAALQEIQLAGFTRQQYIDHCYGTTGATWGGDRCGCPDDRCAGHHHDVGQDCRCLPAVLAGLARSADQR